jgi:hypothetical protein
MFLRAVYVWLQMGLWIIGFIDHLQVITTSNYNTITDFYALQNRANSFRASNVLHRRFLVMASNHGYSSLPGLKSSLNGGTLLIELLSFETPVQN